MARVLYHIVAAAELRACLKSGFYRPANLDREGFVHCALRGSVLAVASDYFANVAGELLLLEIDPERLGSEVRLEAPAPGPGAGTAHLATAARFPHVYGPIEKAAIRGVGTLIRDPSGFHWPRIFVGLEAALSAASAPMGIRAGSAGDRELLEQMLFEAFFWDSTLVRPALAAFREQEEFAKLLDGWGRPGDRAVVAEAGTTRLGAAWYRLWTLDRHSYGFVDERTPEVGIGVAPAHRGQGIGRALLRALVETAQADGFSALSLSVSPSNVARRLYESEGFRKVGESGTSWTLRLDLARQTSS